MPKPNGGDQYLLGTTEKWKRGKYRKRAEREYEAKSKGDPDRNVGQVPGHLYDSPNKRATGGKELSRKEVRIREQQVADKVADQRGAKSPKAAKRKAGRGM